jgi:hypothetical protein
MNLMQIFFKLQNEVDTELLGLLAKFVDRALATGDPKSFLKGVLRAVVETPESAETQTITVPLLGKGKGKKS